MSPVYLAAKAAERRRAEQSAEFARQLPLYRDNVTEPPAEYLEWREGQGEGARAFTCAAPDWMTNY
jgi:hypothetical protein